MNEVIVKSEWKGWIWLVIIQIISLGTYFYVSSLNGHHFHSFFTLVIGVPLLVTILCTPLSSSISTGSIAPWNWRKVIVYSDYIEIKFPFNKERSYEIYLKDIDCYCIEQYEVYHKVKGGTRTAYHERIFLMTGDKLWLYVSDEDVLNFETMRFVISDYFKIPKRPGYIQVEPSDIKLAVRDGYIRLHDINKTELEQWKTLRMERSMPCNPPVLPSSGFSLKWLAGCAGIALIAIILLVVLINKPWK